MKKINKKNLIELLAITSATLLLCSNFLQMHFASDTYVLYDFGYFGYAYNFFLRDGRFLSSLACCIAGLLKLPIPVYIVTMDFIGMIFISLSIFVISKTICTILKPQNLWFEILIILASFCLILNQYSLEYLLFPESAVMCMGVFFLVLSIKNLVKRPKFMYIKIWATLFITSICYQGELNMFPLLVVLIYVLKQIKENKKIGTFLKEFVIESIKLTLILIAIMAITALIAAIGQKLIYYAPNHFINILNKRKFWKRFNEVKFFVKTAWTECMHMLPKHTLTVTSILTLILLIISRCKKQTFIYYVILVFLAFASAILPLFVFNSRACGRVCAPIMMVFGISALILIAENLPSNKNYMHYIAACFTIICFLGNSFFIIQNTSQHIAVNRIDQNNGATINKLIKKYEQENNITVTKLAYRYDSSPKMTSIGIKPMQSLTERPFYIEGITVFAMNYYCNKKFDVVKFEWPEDNRFTENNIPNYDQFLEEQIWFKGDTVYMLIY